MRYAAQRQKKEQPTITLPSLYGSHSTMLDCQVNRIDSGGSVWVLLRDEKGVYETTRDRLDTGLADPRRYASDRVIETPNVKVVVKK